MSNGSRFAGRIGLLLLVLYAAWFFSWSGNAFVQLAGSSVLHAAAALYAGIVMMIACRQSNGAKHWLYYGLGSFIFFAAQTQWTTELLETGVLPDTFGPAQVIWLLQYPCFTIALFYQKRTFRNSGFPFFLDIILFATVSVTLYWQLFIRPAIGDNIWPDVMTGFYLTGSCINLSIMMGIVFFIAFHRSRISKTSGCLLAVGFLAKTAAGWIVLYLWDTADLVKWQGAAETCWFLSSIFFGLAAAYGKLKPRLQAPSKSKYEELKQYVPIALGGLLLMALLAGSFPSTPVEYGSLVGVGLLIARLFLGIRDSDAVNRALRLSNMNYRNWVDNALVGVFIEQEGKLVYVNRHCEEIFGYSAGEMLGTTLLGHLSFEDVTRFLSEADKLRKRIPTSRFGISGVKNDKTPLHLEMQLAMTSYEGREAVSGTLVDITERKMSEQWLIRSEKLSVVGQLAAGVAHEIRNPLTALKGFTQLLHQNSGDNNHSYYEIMLTELERINYIVGEFMLLSKPFNRQQLKEHDIHRILTSIVPILESQAILHNVIIRIETQRSLPLVRCDENQMKQVLINLMKNAIEAMPGGGTVTVRYGVDDYHKELVVYIEDEGVGIPSDLLERLGEPFLTTKEKGTGLGLMVCYKIIEAHEGMLSVSSKPGQGTVVKIALPAR